MHLADSFFALTEVRRSPSFYCYRFNDRAKRIGEREEIPAGMYTQKPHLQVSYEEIPHALEQAFLAIEDKRFYQHRGVDWYRTVGAGLNVLLGFSDSFGGSTLTQQLVKNVTGDREVTVHRKLQEILYALDLERRLDKSQILEWYLNVIYFSDGCNGVAEAAEHYFSKSVQELTLAECASLAAIANNPSYYHPLRREENNLRRRDLILDEMYAQGRITQEELLSAQKEPLTLRLHAASDEENNSWYIDMAIEDVTVDLMREYGVSRAEAARWINYGGLCIDLAMDPWAQTLIEEYAESRLQLPTKDTGEPAQSAVILLDNRTGDILAVAGAAGKKSGNLVQNFATQTRRSPGSCIKPVTVYAPALERGLIHWGSIYDDVPVRFFPETGTAWPRNASGIYRGLTTVSYAVAHSTNTVAVRVLEDLGLEESFRAAREDYHLPLISDGRGNDCDYAALALGQLNFGLTLREMTAAYTPFADGGLYHPWRSYFRVLDADGNLLLSNPDRAERVLSEGNAAIMTKLLQGCVSEGTASSIRLSGLVECAGKTGTTSSEGDRWFIGYTPELLCGVWCGYEYPAPLRGRTLCTGIWDDLMTELFRERGGKTQFPIPEEVIRLSFCKDSGDRMGENCLLDPRGAREEVGWFLRENLPQATCTRHVLCAYDGENGGVAHAETPIGQLVPTALLRIERAFPWQIRVKDAQYSFLGDPLSLPPNPNPQEAYFASDRDVFFGESGGDLPYNRSAPILPEADEDGDEEETEEMPRPFE